MGCTHSDLVLARALAANPNQVAEENAKFTSDEIELIRSSWKLIEDKKEFGMCMMIK
jgi:hypothetical protein